MQIGRGQILEAKELVLVERSILLRVREEGVVPVTEMAARSQQGCFG
jgi:hypothetical protein